jgi:putative peptidoglycan lipid II flippase
MFNPSIRLREELTLVVDSTRATAAAVLGYVPGFFVPLAIAAFLGANARTDAFFLALSVASLVANSLGVTTQQAAIPFLVDARRAGHDVGRFVGEISTALLLLAVLPILVLNGSVVLYVQNSSGWSGADRQLLHQLLWVFVPYIFSSVLAGVYSGALNSQHRYVTAAVSPAIRSVTVLLAVLATPLIGIYALVYGYIIGEGLRLVYLFRTLVRQFSIRVLAWPHASSLPDFSRTAVAQMLGSGVLAFLPLLDRMMASPLGAGSVSLLDYADRLWQVPIGFAMSGFMVTSLSHWSERLHRAGTVQGLVRDTLHAAVFLFLVFLIPTMMFLEWRAPLMNALFRSSKFTGRDLELITKTLAGLIIGTPIYVAGLIYTRAFLVLKRSDWLFGVSLVQLIVKVALNLLLIPLLGLAGIAIATSVTYLISTVCLMAIFHLRLASGTLPVVPIPSLTATGAPAETGRVSNAIDE